MYLPVKINFQKHEQSFWPPTSKNSDYKTLQLSFHGISDHCFEISKKCFPFSQSLPPGNIPVPKTHTIKPSGRNTT